MKKSMRTVLFSNGKASNSTAPSMEVLTSFVTELEDIPPASSVNDQFPNGKSISKRPKSSTSSLHTAVV